MKKSTYVSKDKNKKSGSACSYYRQKDFDRYFAGAMTELEIERILDHIERCDMCKLVFLTNRQEMEKVKDAEFTRKTLNLLDRLDK